MPHATTTPDPARPTSSSTSSSSSTILLPSPSSPSSTHSPSHSHSLFFASLLTGTHSRLRRRGAIRQRARWDDSDSELSLSGEDEEGESKAVEIYCGRALRRARPPLPPPSYRSPLPPRSPPRSPLPRPPPAPVGGCGALVHSAAVPSRDPAGDYAARTPPTALVVPMRRRRVMLCGCERVGVGCRVCGTKLGTYTLCLCPAHSPSPSRLPQRHRRPSLPSPQSRASDPARWHFRRRRVFLKSAPVLGAYDEVSADEDEEDEGEAAEEAGAGGDGGGIGIGIDGARGEEGAERAERRAFDPDGEPELPGPAEWGEKEW